MSPVAPTVGWIGLGRMGARMARRISEHHRVLGFDLAGPKALETSLGCSSPGAPAPLNSKLNIDLAASPGEVFRRCNVVFCALPTSNEVAAIAQQAVEAVRDVRRDEAERLQSESRDNGATSRGQQEKILVDCSSGDCMRTREIGEFLHTEANIAMFDCPVSGGPIGAAAGTLCAMIGGGSTTDSAELLYNSRLEPLIALFAREKRFFVGPLGSAHAVKSINNLMNATHLIAGVEGLLALQKFGISPERALACINGSSGRSLQTEVRIPKEVLTRRFNYGFQYSLMEKDCRQGLELVRKMEVGCFSGKGGRSSSDSYLFFYARTVA